MKTVIPSKPTSIRPIVEQVITQARALGYSRNACHAVHLALDEALANAIRHGNGGDPDKKVTVDCSVSDDAVRLAVSDEGKGFDPATVPDPTQNHRLNTPGGRGLYLMRAYMDQVYFNDHGNCVILVKRRDSPAIRAKAG